MRTILRLCLWETIIVILILPFVIALESHSYSIGDESLQKVQSLNESPYFPLKTNTKAHHILLSELDNTRMKTHNRENNEVNKTTYTLDELKQKIYETLDALKSMSPKRIHLGNHKYFNKDSLDKKWKEILASASNRSRKNEIVNSIKSEIQEARKDILDEMDNTEEEKYRGSKLLRRVKKTDNTFNPTNVAKPIVERNEKKEINAYDDYYENNNDPVIARYIGNSNPANYNLLNRQNTNDKNCSKPSESNATHRKTTRAPDTKDKTEADKHTWKFKKGSKGGYRRRKDDSNSKHKKWKLLPKCCDCCKNSDFGCY